MSGYGHGMLLLWYLWHLSKFFEPSILFLLGMFPFGTNNEPAFSVGCGRVRSHGNSQTRSVFRAATNTAGK